MLKTKVLQELSGEKLTPEVPPFETLTPGSLYLSLIAWQSLCARFYLPGVAVPKTLALGDLISQALPPRVSLSKTVPRATESVNPAFGTPVPKTPALKLPSLSPVPVFS